MAMNLEQGGEGIRDAIQRGRISEAVIALFQHAPVGLALVDERLRFLFANGAFARLLGFTADDPFGRYLAEIAGANGLVETVSQVLRTAVRSEGSLEQAERRWHTDCYPVESAGRVLAVAVISRAHSPERDARQLAAMLREASMTLTDSLEYEPTLERVGRSLVPQIADLCLVSLLDAQGRIEAVAVAHQDKATQDAVWSTARQFSPDPHGTHPIAKAIRTGRGELLSDLEPARSNGGERSPFLGMMGARSAVVVPLVAQGHHMGALSLISVRAGWYRLPDLSAAEEFGCCAGRAIHNARLYREARLAVAAKQELLAMVSHDLRNPVSAFRLGCDMLSRILAKDQRVAPIRQHIDRLERAAEKMAERLDDLADMSSIEAGRMSIRKEVVDVHRVAREAVGMLRPLAEERDIRLGLSARGSALVRCDPHRLAQVFENLLGNAIKVSPKKGRVVVRSRPGMREVEFAVSDSGPGISPTEREHLFEKFWTGHRTSGGWGLGLFIVRGVVDAHGGRVWVRSRIGKGSTFYFTLPRGVTQQPTALCE
jgi:PAS domain S-box-containing protein